MEDEDDEDNKILEQSWYLCAKEVVEFTLFGQSFLGKILVITLFVICNKCKPIQRCSEKTKILFVKFSGDFYQGEYGKIPFKDFL